MKQGLLFAQTLYSRDDFWRMGYDGYSFKCHANFGNPLVAASIIALNQYKDRFGYIKRLNPSIQDEVIDLLTKNNVAFLPTEELDDVDGAHAGAYI